MFWERFYDLCIKKNTKPNPVVKAIGLSSPVATKWKKDGALPNGETLIKLADYLGCSVDYLLGRADQPTAIFADASLPEGIKKYLQLSPTGQKAADNMLDSLLLMENPQQPPALTEAEKEKIALAALKKQQEAKKQGVRLVAYGGDNRIMPPPTPEQIAAAEKLYEQLRSQNKNTDK